MSTTNVLNVGNSLEHVVKVDVGRVLGGSALPEGKSVDEQDIRRLDDGIRSSIGVFVPAVGGADLDAWERLLDGLHLACELLAGEVAAVEGLGSDSYGVDLVLE